MISRDRIIDANPIARYLSAIGHELKGEGAKASARCPFHDDKSPSMSVNTDKGLWFCHACGFGGTVIDMHMRRHGLSCKDALAQLAEGAGLRDDMADKPQKVATYIYRDSLAREVMRIDRIETGKDKKFRQYTVDPAGQEHNGIDGVARVLFRMERWAGKAQVALCEGEKCVAALESIGIDATTNPGGSSNWKDAYAQYLVGKHVEVWPDNDAPGDKWLAAVLKSLEGKVAALRIMRVPDPYNDVADLVIAQGQEYATETIMRLADQTPWIDKGVDLPLLSSREAFDIYRRRVMEAKDSAIDLGRWLPSLKSWSRPLMPGDMMVIQADTGVGKCLGAGTPVMKADGTCVSVETIAVGDCLMGPDSKPRTVRALHSQLGLLYRVTPKNGDAFVCNENHMLTLVSVNNPSRHRAGGIIKDVPLKEYLAWPAEQKHIHKLFKVGVEFPFNPVPIDPYWLGLWLGDGSTAQVAITVADEDVEIADYLTKWARDNGHGVRCERRGDSKCQTWAFPKLSRVKGAQTATGKALSEYGIRHTDKRRGKKRIPKAYLMNSEAVRLEVLAGLIDSDGYKTQSGVLQVCGVNRDLMNDCLYLARSLGFRASLKDSVKTIRSIGYSVEAYTVTISGDVERIPVRLKRKAVASKPNKDWMRTGFTVERIADGMHYGFEIDGDGRFLLGDFTVTHNTALLLNLAYSQRPLPCILFEIELSECALVERFIARDLGMETLEVERAVERGHEFDVSGWSNVYLCPESKLDAEKMGDIIERSELKIGRRPALVLVDYIGLMDGPGGKRYERMSTIAEELKRLARSTRTVICVASQVARDKDRTEINLHDAKDSGSIESSAQLVIGAWRPDTDRLTLRILKQTRRAGVFDIECRYDGNKQTIQELFIE